MEVENEWTIREGETIEDGCEDDRKRVVKLMIDVPHVHVFGKYNTIIIKGERLVN